MVVVVCVRWWYCVGGDSVYICVLVVCVVMVYGGDGVCVVVHVGVSGDSSM